MLSPTKARNEAERLLLALLEQGLLLDYRSPVLVTSNRVARVTWPTAASSKGLVVPEEFGTVPEYRRMLRDQEYSAVLFDGALIQLGWTFFRSSLTKYRLCYYPCPVEVRSRLAEAGSLTVEDVIDESLLADFAGDLNGRNFYEDPAKDEFPVLRLRSPVRFDFDIGAAASGHSPSHVTIGHAECRIPVSGPICLGHFVRLIFRNFYAELWSANDFLREWKLSHFGTTIADDELAELHIAWRSAPHRSD